MTKTDLINAVNDRANEGGIELTKKDTGELLDIVFDVVAGAVSHERRFSYPGFGTFSVKHRKEREGRNPRTGKPIKIPASYTVGFKPAPKLRDEVN
jgi:DNA-binding protein HU-beta